MCLDASLALLFGFGGHLFRCYLKIAAVRFFVCACASMCVNVKTKWGGSRVTADGRGSRNRSQKIPVGESFYNREE